VTGHPRPIVPTRANSPTVHHRLGQHQANMRIGQRAIVPAFALMIYRASQTRNTGPAVKPHRNTSPRPFKHRRPQHLTATQSCRPPINEETCEQYQRLSGRIEHACAGGTQANATRASGSTTCLRHKQHSQARHLASCRHKKQHCAAHLSACKHLLTIPSQSQT
jgi:hypothetical protein